MNFSTFCSIAVGLRPDAPSGIRPDRGTAATGCSQGGGSMGDKGGKKDKAKSEKQKVSRKKGEDRKKQERVPKRVP
jgi:hypothetical protein